MTFKYEQTIALHTKKSQIQKLVTKLVGIYLCTFLFVNSLLTETKITEQDKQKIDKFWQVLTFIKCRNLVPIGNRYYWHTSLIESNKDPTVYYCRSKIYLWRQEMLYRKKQETKHFVLSRLLSFSLGCSSSLKPSWIVVLFTLNSCCTIVSIFFNPFPWHVKNLPSQRILCEITNNELPVISLRFDYW